VLNSLIRVSSECGSDDVILDGLLGDVGIGNVGFVGDDCD